MKNTHKKQGVERLYYRLTLFFLDRITGFTGKNKPRRKMEFSQLGVLGKQAS